MKRFLAPAFALAMAALVAMMSPAVASARGFTGRGYGGGFRGVRGYGYNFGYYPFYGGFGNYPYYGGFGYYPYYGGFGYPLYTKPTQGNVKFDVRDKSDKAAMVFVNEAYAGTVGKVKTLHLAPGTYTIQVEMPGRETFESKVYVTAGNTVHLKPKLTPVQTAAGAESSGS